MIVVDKSEDVTVDLLIERLTKLQDQGHGKSEVMIFDSNEGTASCLYAWLDSFSISQNEGPIKMKPGQSILYFEVD